VLIYTFFKFLEFLVLNYCRHFLDLKRFWNVINFFLKKSVIFIVC